MSANASTNSNSDKTSKKKLHRFKDLAMPKIRIDRSTRLNAFEVKPAALTYKITDSLNKLAQPKRRYRSDIYRYSNSSFLTPTPTLKPEKLSQGSSQTNRETYANIAASRNIRYLKHMHDFLRPMKNFSGSASGYSHNENKSHNVKTYKPGNKQGQIYRKKQDKM